MKIRPFKFLSLVTACALLLGSMPLLTAASGETTITETASSTIIREDTALRGEYEKHFLMSDGSYQAVVYDEPVHQLVDGTWEDVDNSLILSASTDGVSEYTTANGITDVSFAQGVGNKLVTIKQDAYSLSWGVQAVSNNTSVMSASLIQAATAQAEVISADLSGISAEEQKTMASKSTSTIQYSNALAQGVDLKYTVLPSRVKEDIILQSPQNISAYTVTIYTEGLSAQLLENRDVTFSSDDDEVIFTMHAPYMYDSAGELSEDITVSLSAKGDDCYILTMTPDAVWLSDPSRVYPVVIDPNVSPRSAKSNILDNYVLEGSGVQNNNLDRLYVGNKSGATARAYIKYRAMPYIPTARYINSATMRVRITSGTSTTNKINIYTVTSGDWSPSAIHWNSMPTAGGILQTSVPATTDSSGNLIYQFSCTSAVRAWYTGSVVGQTKNYGIMIRYTDESISDYNAFYSGDCATESSRPALTINYTLPEVEESTIVWPAPGHYDVTSEWGYRNYDSEMHYGIDISCDGLKVVAAIGGTIRTSYTSEKGYIMVIEKPGSEFQAHYYHLKEGGYLVDKGATVEPGQKIAVSGNTGKSDGAHLHFQLQFSDNRDFSYNPIEIYHPDDARSTWTNPNPMFYLADGIYIPNEYFDYTYTPSNYNSTDAELWKK